jgi:peptidoglycan hydrolase-like protein with peptidoglycan-binding domain
VLRTIQNGARQRAHAADISQAAPLYSGKPPTQAEGKVARVQSAYGNQGMQRLLSGGILQRKLTINQPGDVYEREADRMADAVMRSPDPVASRNPITPAGSTTGLQRSSCGESSVGECEECKAKSTRLQRSAGYASTSATAPPVVHDVLSSPGQPLDAVTRSFMETRFGHDFSRVRVHTDGKAADSARAVKALAYTVGNDIAFASGQYAAGSSQGRRLLAHELSHVLQQTGASCHKRLQRVAQETGTGTDCTDSTPPPLDQWSADSTLNAIRSEAIGDNSTLVSRGRKGETVRLIQQALIASGCDLEKRNLLPKFGADGDFGAETERATRSFQGAVGIAQDGIVGPVTLSRLDSFVAYGTIPVFPSVHCKVVPPDVPASVIQSLAKLGFAASSNFSSPDRPPGEQAVSAGIAGVPILCDIGSKGGGGGGGKPPAGICSGQPQHVVSIGNATFALCDFIDGSRLTAGAIPRPRPGKEAGFVEMRALGIALFGSVGSSLPTTGPGSADTDWQHGFIQTVQSLKYTATYQRGWSSVREVATPRRDATGSSVSGPWYSNQSIPAFQFQVGKKLITVGGPIALGPEFIGTDPVGILDDPRAIFVDTVPINADPVCPCSFLQTVEAKGELDTWLVVTPAGKGTSLTDLAFLKHAETKFDLKADTASGFAVQGTPTMNLENGQGQKTPVLTGSLANDDLKNENLTRGAACPVTIPSVKCPVESPTGPPGP